MSTVLRTIHDDALRLKDMLLGARETGDLSADEAQRALTYIAAIINQVVNANGSPYRVPVNDTPPMSEYFRYPNSRMACPKCGDTKLGTIDYQRATKLYAERVKHSCRCGYHIFTKPLDGSTDPNVEFDDE